MAPSAWPGLDAWIVRLSTAPEPIAPGPLSALTVAVVDPHRRASEPPASGWEAPDFEAFEAAVRSAVHSADPAAAGVLTTLIERCLAGPGKEWTESFAWDVLRALVACSSAPPAVQAAYGRLQRQLATAAPKELFLFAQNDLVERIGSDRSWALPDLRDAEAVLAALHYAIARLTEAFRRRHLSETIPLLTQLVQVVDRCCARAAPPDGHDGRVVSDSPQSEDGARPREVPSEREVGCQMAHAVVQIAAYVPTMARALVLSTFERFPELLLRQPPVPPTDSAAPAAAPEPAAVPRELPWPVDASLLAHAGSSAAGAILWIAAHTDPATPPRLSHWDTAAAAGTAASAAGAAEAAAKTAVTTLEGLLAATAEGRRIRMAVHALIGRTQSSPAAIQRPLTALLLRSLEPAAHTAQVTGRGGGGASDDDMSVSASSLVLSLGVALTNWPSLSARRDGFALLRRLMARMDAAARYTTLQHGLCMYQAPELQMAMLVLLKEDWLGAPTARPPPHPLTEGPAPAPAPAPSNPEPPERPVDWQPLTGEAQTDLVALLMNLDGPVYMVVSAPEDDAAPATPTAADAMVALVHHKAGLIAQWLNMLVGISRQYLRTRGASQPALAGFFHPQLIRQTESVFLAPLEKAVRAHAVSDADAHRHPVAAMQVCLLQDLLDRCRSLFKDAFQAGVY
ncbi:hypothetical protein CXG81DRAFT_27153 [Caulochytrium protostelioides]|uniref:Uncharacterized protein n=1 Tax=Caulochytrium protostelioides TaxID=1555241 RepID=A0A4V1IUC9_9FUNG|nr:hypothetical protein CXG81DRAFT_27153 [Caulochytrium protostelioides]|eukprot:RKP00119.1 hypothetical protein CXG81DRAFT_27153 [Caulochytrium protostelioides]